MANAQRVEELLTRLGDLPPGQDQLDLLVRITRMRVEAKDYEEAIELAFIGVESARELDLFDQVVEFELVVAECAQVMGDEDACLNHALRAYSYTPEQDKIGRSKCALLLARAYMRQAVPDKAQEYAQQALSPGTLSTAERREAQHVLIQALTELGDSPRALSCLNELVDEARSTGDDPLRSIALASRSRIHQQLQDIESAIDDEIERLELCKEPERGIVANNIGELHSRAGRHDQAHRFFGEAATWLALEPDLYGRCLVNSAISYAREQKLAMAEQTIDNAIGVIGGRGSGTDLAEAIMVRSGILLLAGRHGDAMTTARTALDESQRLKDRYRELEALELLARIALERGTLVEKQQFDLRAFTLRHDLAVQEQMQEHLRTQHENDLHRQERDIISLAGSEQRERLRAREAILAAEYQANEFGLLVAETELQEARIREEALAGERALQELSLLRATMAGERQDRELKELQDERTVRLLEMNKLDLERKQKETSLAMLKRQNDLLEKDSELKAVQQERAEVVARSSIAAVALLLGVAAFFFWVIRKVKGKNRLIRQQVAQIGAINSELTDKNADLLSSITYAHNIQRAIIPTESHLRELVPDSFLYYRPRDIVSGDLPFIRRAGNRLFLATIDCTGHGVPAAMLSFMAYYNLNDIISTQPDLGVNDILAMLHLRIRDAVHARSGSHAMSDGMDITLVELDLDNGTLWYSGAQNALMAVRNGVSERIKGDKCSIGDPSGDCSNGFRAHRLDLGPGDRIFLFSDGLIHQFGGADGRKKYSNARFAKRLEELAPHAAHEAGLFLSEEHRAWQGDIAQTDDIVLIGFSINRTVTASRAA
jgi:serine phosphatase RsbU (regulator of sigma subunit)